MTTVVELAGAARRFGSGHTEVTALHPTTLTVEAGELLAVMGPSGSGKTTLLSLVGGLDPGARAAGGSQGRRRRRAEVDAVPKPLTRLGAGS